MPYKEARIKTTETVYVTKYALTTGIMKLVMEVDGNRKYASVNTPGLHFLAPADWHTTLEAAHAAVTKMIAAKRKSLGKAMAKLDRQSDLLKAGRFALVDKTAPTAET